MFGSTAALGCTRTGQDARELRSLISVVLLISFLGLSVSSRAINTQDAYCPPVPAFGQLVFRSVESQSSFCTPSIHDYIGSAVYTCLQSLDIEVNGCEVVVRTDEGLVVGPGKLPCGYFSLRGNLTGAGVEALVWAQVDGPALLGYYYDHPEAVRALLYDSPRQLVVDLWDFLYDFTADLRFEDSTWIDDAIAARHERGHHSSAAVAAGASNRTVAAGNSEGGHEEALMPQHQQQGHEQEASARQAMVVVAAQRGQQQELQRAAGAGGRLRRRAAVEADAEGGLVRSARPQRRSRHGPMRLYRPAQTRVVLKVPTGCKYRYTVNANSHVFETPAQHRNHVQWRTIGLTVAALSVLLTVLGLGVCVHFSRKHAEYVATYWEYQAVKDQLGSELPPATYQRLFGELPKSAGAAAEVTAAATAAAMAARGRQAAGGGAAAAAAGSGAAAPAVLPPAVQQHTSSALQADGGEAVVNGTGGPDGVNSRCSSAAGNENAPPTNVGVGTLQGTGAAEVLAGSGETK